MTAETIARALGGHRAGAGWTARCPAHDDRTPSLSLTDTKDGKLLVRCHAGCDQKDVIAALRGRGLWGEGRSRAGTWAQRRKPVEREPDGDDAKRTQRALAIWQSSRPSPETPVETYLASRGLHLPPSDALRFHPAMKHPAGGFWPAMVALVTKGLDGEPVAVHRTFLAAMQASGHPAWAALSTSGLRALDLPKDVRDVIVLADGDEAGEAAARDCALRWKREGRRVRIARPPQGMDFNDMLSGQAPHTEEGAQ